MICQGVCPVSVCVSWVVLLIPPNFRLAGKAPRQHRAARQRKGMSLNPRHVTPHCPMPEQQDCLGIVLKNPKTELV